jgi:hypothetical protein
MDTAVSLPEGDEGERAVVASMVRRESDDLAAALRVTPPSRLVVRFHTTTGAYERATGVPWFTLGAVVGDELHFVPIAMLRDRGVLERTVRRQAVHAMIDAALSGRSAWVREGAAIHFAEPAAVPVSRGPCPRDAELLQPPSVGALTDAYARARSCFERQLGPRGSWRDVK